MQNYALTRELVHQRHADLHRQAAEARLGAQGRPGGGSSNRGDGGSHRSARRRLGLLLVAWGSRLAPVATPDTPC
jgi:hypothetical protein